VKTLNHLIAGSCTKYANRSAMGMAFEIPITYEELGDRIKQTAVSLLERGIKRGDHVAILAENSPNWGIIYLAIVRLGAVAVPILPDFLESDVRHILSDSEAKILFTTGRQLEKLYELSCKRLELVVTMDDSSAENKPISITRFSDFLTDEQEGFKKQKDKIAELAGRVKEDDLAAIIYTSGTSGHSKAVMLTHRNLVSNVDSARGIIDIRPEWTFLSILPLSHAYEFTAGFLLPISRGSRIVYLGGRPTPSLMQKVCQQEKPSASCVVPMVLEKIYKKRVLPTLEKNPLVRLVIGIPGMRARIYRKIGKRLLDFFGGQLVLLAIGGAAINHEVEEFLHQAKFPYIVGYGLTETSPLLTGGPFKDPTVRVGSAGKPVPQVRIKIVNKQPESGIGEIYASGPNIMAGYYKNKELTELTFDADGWLATGDLGYLDELNNLFIMGRSKSVIVLSHGENIYPEAIEDKIYSYRHVVECLVVARNDKLEALVYLDYEVVDDETGGKSQQEKKEYINTLLEQIRKEVNQDLPLYSQLASLVERPEPFIKTATHKIKRYLYCQSAARG
jgi:long-chain acyl-CoA synthetase